MNLTALQNDVLSRLNEASNSTVGDLPAGTGGTSTIATASQITTYLNDAGNDLARSCVRVDDTGTYTVPSGTQFVQWGLLTTSLGHTVRGARTVVYNGIQLLYADEAIVDLYFPSKATDATGAPLYWYPESSAGIGLYPRPSSGSQVLSIDGVCTPKPLVSGTDVPTWLPLDKHLLLSLYAAMMMARKNAEDPNLIGRAAQWQFEYEQQKAALLQGIYANDPYTAQMHFPPLPAPDPMQGGTGQA